jgi:DUF4097 and DUF4098 domain-containing protein YvlB
MAGYPPPYPPPPGVPPGPPFGGYRADLKYQRRVLRDQARAQRELFRAQRDAYRAQYRGMRRGSIVGPILVITIGVLFLLVQLGKLPSYSLWNWFGRWWPLLLIGVGVVVLIEWGVDTLFHNDDQPRFRRSIGGGVTALIIVMIVFGITFETIHDGGRDFFAHNFTLNQDDLDQFLGDKHDSDQTIAQSFPAQGTLEVSNPRGDITISGTSDDNQIHVILHKEIYTRTDSDAASKAQQLSPSLIADGSTLRLTLPAIEGAHVDMIVTVPAASSNTVNANHGDVHLSGLKGPVNITANHGDVELSSITGPVTAHIQNGKSDFSAHTVTGPISLEGKGGDVTISDIAGPVGVQGDFFGNIHIEHVTEGFKFHSSRTDFQIARLDGATDFTEGELSADQAVGPLVLSTRNRNVTLDRVSGDVTITNRNGKVDLTGAPPLGNINVENRNGEVNLTLPEQSGFHISAETTDADIENDFSLPVTENSNRKSLNGTLGKGGPTIKIVTTQEDISLKRASIAPLPPAPPPPPSSDTPPAAKQAIRDAQRAAAEAQRQAKQAGEEARREAQKAAAEARKAAQDAQDAAHP